MSRKKKVQQIDAENKILEKIAKYGPTHIYPFHEPTYKQYYIASRATVYHAKDSLLQKNLIEFERPQTVKNRKRKIYTLTQKGICKFLVQSEWLHKKPEHIMEKWGHHMPILKKLPLFDKYNVGINLLSQIRFTLGEIAFTPKVNYSHFTGIIKRAVCRLLAEKTISPELRMKYNKILQEDSELREATKKYLQSRRCLAFIRVIEATERLKLVFPLLESDNPDWCEIQKTEEYLDSARSDCLDESIKFIEGSVIKRKEEYARLEKERKA